MEVVLQITCGVYQFADDGDIPVPPVQVAELGYTAKRLSILFACWSRALTRFMVEGFY